MEIFVLPVSPLIYGLSIVPTGYSFLVRFLFTVAMWNATLMLPIFQQIISPSGSHP